MSIEAETYLVVALAFAVFSAITAIGSALVLGVGFERLRAGFEIVRKQTAYFSDAIFSLEKRVDAQDAKIADGVDTGKAESLVRHAENLLTEIAHIARGMKPQRDVDHVPQAEEEESADQPQTVAINPASLPESAAQYASQWKDLGRDDRANITLM